MDYFIELLESYSKLKKRKLKLLKEATDAESIAAQELSKAQSINPPPKLNSPYIATGIRAQVGIFASAKGWKFAPMSANGILNPGSSKFIDSDYQTFVGYFTDQKDVNGGASQKDGSKFVKAQGGEHILGSELAQQYPEELAEVAAVFQNIMMGIENTFNGIDKKLLKGKNWENFKNFTTYIYGKRKGSLESKLLHLRTKIEIDPSTNSYTTFKIPSDPFVLKTIAKNLELIFTSLGKDNLNDGNISNKLTSILAVNSDGSVTIFEDGLNSGLVFNDDSGFLKMVTKALAQKFNLKFAKLNVVKATSTGLDNAIRGTALEEVLPVFSLLKRQSTLAKIGHPGSKVIQKLIDKCYVIVKDKLNKMHASYQGWVKDFEDSAFEEEDMQVVRDFSLIFGKGGKKLVSSMMKVSKDAISLRKPDFIITTGRETGEGRRGDVTELYNSYEQAQAALVKMGYSEKDIALNNLIKVGTSETLFAGKEDQLKLAYKAEIFKKGSPIYYISVSLKNYLSLDEAVFGTATVGSIRNFIGGTGADPDNKFLRNYQKITNQTPQQYEAVKQYDQKLFDIGGKIRSLDAKAKSRNKSTGNLKNITPFADFIESALKSIKDNSTYEELHDPLFKEGDKGKRELANILNRYLDSIDDEEKEYLEDKIKQHTTTYLKNKKLTADIENRDEAAMQYLAMKMFAAGGSVDDGLVCDYRGLSTSEQYNFLQNDIVRNVMSSFLANDGVWKLATRGNNFIFFNSKNPKEKLMVIDKVEKRISKEGLKYYSTKTSVIVNRELMSSYNKKTSSIASSTLESFLNYQKVFLEYILELKSEENTSI